MAVYNFYINVSFHNRSEFIFSFITCFCTARKKHNIYQESGFSFLVKITLSFLFFLQSHLHCMGYI